MGQWLYPWPASPGAAAKTPVAVGTDLIGKQVTLRFDGSMMYVIHAGLLVDAARADPAPAPREYSRTAHRSSRC